MTTEAAALFRGFTQGPLSTEQWRAEIAANSPHILIYPEIGMDPMAVRLAAQRLAPVQCASWGHPVTSGLPTVDYFLSSDAMEPSNAQAAYTERLVRLPGLSTRVHVQKTTPPATPRAKLGLPEGAPVFWCAQSPYKYSPEHDAVLARIAARAPAARFVFVAFPGSDRLTQHFRQRLATAFDQQRPGGGEQIVMLPRLSPEAFMAAMASADVVLDSLGWSGCNTLVEALLAGIPVVSTPGPFMRGRHGSALLSMIGLGDVVCADTDAYIDRAVTLAETAEVRQLAAKEVLSRSSRLFVDDQGAIAELEMFLTSSAERLIVEDWQSR